MTEERFAVEQLFARYCHCIDDDRLEEWPGLFTADGVYQVTSRENARKGWQVGMIYCDSRGMMIDRVAAMRKAIVFEPHHYRHSYSALLLEPGEGCLVARTSFQVLRIMQDGRTDLYCSGLWRDRIVATEDGYQFAERIVELDSPRIDTLMVIPI